MNYNLLHPEILSALASAGHGAQVAICDGNFATQVRAPEGAHIVYLNLTPGVLSVTEIFKVIVGTVPLEKVVAMMAPDDVPAEVQEEVKSYLPGSVEFELRDKLDFYALVKSEMTALLIASADTRRFANLVLTIGVVK